MTLSTNIHTSATSANPIDIMNHQDKKIPYSSSGDKGNHSTSDLQYAKLEDPPLPPRNASPEQVRDYINQLLTTKRNLPNDELASIAARWTVGSGQELRSYSPSMYFQVFGYEDGWIVFHEVKLALYREDDKQKTNFQRYWPCE